jgi:predicted acyltransferase
MALVESASRPRAKSSQAGASKAVVGRLSSLDAFRGFTMICMIAEGFGLLYFLKGPIIGPIANQFRHVDWTMSIPADIHFWDLIQPFFMFIVGAVMPISFARRWAAGEPWSRSLLHVVRRSALLILLGLIARSCQAKRPVLDLINVLAQIAFTYLIAFLVLRKHWSIQAGVGFAFLALHWALYQFGQAPGVAGPWVKDGNIGWYLDGLILHKHWSGSYATINCISSTANTIFGVMAGELLIGKIRQASKLWILIATGVFGVVAGIALSPLVPLNKKIWTASFAIYSTGFTLLALALFYWIFDLKEKRNWGKLFVIVGSNSIFIYVFHEILHRYLSSGALLLLSWAVNWWGAVGKMFAAWLVIGFEILVCYILYRRKIFLRV